MTAPLENEAPTNEKALNLPEEPDDVEGGNADENVVPNGSELEEVVKVDTKVNDDEKS